MGGDWTLRSLLMAPLSISLAAAGPLRSQIVGGREVKPHTRPYMAALKINGSFAFKEERRDISVILGAHDLNAVEETRQVFGVISYHEHHGYFVVVDIPFNDILLLKQSHPTILNRYVQVVPLPRSDKEVPDGTLCTTSGGGMIDGLVRSYKLYETNITIYNRRKCMKFYPEFRIDEAMICAGSFNQFQDTSQGDSGGPMVCKGVVEGIVSYGNQIPPGVYSRIADFLPWIRHIMISNA